MENMSQFHENGEWARLNAEQINASRTVQQLKGYLQTVDELSHQVRPSDLLLFDRLTESLRRDILSAVQDYQVVTARLELEREGEGGGERRGEGAREEEESQRLLDAVQKDATHCQSLEDLRAVCIAVQ